MSRFYGDLQGSRGEATRGGSKASGIDGHLRGWQIGARVSVYANHNGKDTVAISLTSGSNGVAKHITLGQWQIGDDGEIKKLER